MAVCVRRCLLEAHLLRGKVPLLQCQHLIPYHELAHGGRAKEGWVVVGM